MICPSWATVTVKFRHVYAHVLTSDLRRGGPVTGTRISGRRAAGRRVAGSRVTGTRRTLAKEPTA